MPPKCICPPLCVPACTSHLRLSDSPLAGRDQGRRPGGEGLRGQVARSMVRGLEDKEAATFFGREAASIAQGEGLRGPPGCAGSQGR